MRNRLLTICLMAITLLAANPSAATVAAADWSAPHSVWVAAGGHTLDGPFLDEWRAHRSLLGLPISEQRAQDLAIDAGKTEKRTVQFFENAALVSTPDDARGDSWRMQALPLGREALRRDGSGLRALALPTSGSCGSIPTGDCRRFGASKHTVRYGFKTYWESGDGERLIGLPLTEEFVGAKGWTTQYFERAVLLWKKGKDVRLRAIGKESASARKIATANVAQPLDVPVYSEALFTEPSSPAIIGGVGASNAGPGPKQGGGKEIVVSVSQETVWAYDDGALVITSLVSTGVADSAETVTPVGFFSVLTKYPVQTMAGVINDEAYNVPDVPWVMYFDNLGNALHGTYWHNNFGSPMSHGCVNLPMDVAAFLYGWAPEGTAVTVLA
ncbi:MAG: L,D-transpeptidase family protein [Thermomicrobiales bacterium]